uniref:Methyltransferase type 11 domain-containing protein n=1 Tax=viral metagenome TaxID=1070528 RepID=A0A6C0DLH0_9ZZZZ
MINIKFTLRNILIELLVILGIILLGILLYKISTPPYEKIIQEGFNQERGFVLKREQDIYDDLYVDMYDNLKDIAHRSESELIQILKMTEPSTKHSNFLDIGSGTGYIVNQLNSAGYRAYGLDKSKSMVKYCELKYPNIEIKQGDVFDPMNFERATFSHILCTNFTIYEFKDKLSFLKNCQAWLIPHGYLILHLVKPDKFNITNPNRELIDTKNKSQNRELETKATFDDYNYKAYYDNSNPTAMTFTETFIDKKTKHIRQNEQTLYMDTIENIEKMALSVGFIFHGKVNMKKCSNGDENQYLYILERSQ